MSCLAAGSLVKSLARQPFVGRLSSFGGLLPAQTAALRAWTADLHGDASAVSSRPEASPGRAWDERGIDGHGDTGRRPFSSSGLGAAGAFGKVSEVAGSASKAVADARAWVREAREKVLAAQQRAYLWVPGPVRHVLEAGSSERQKVMSLHFDAFWHSYGNSITLAGGGLGALMLWKLVVGTAGIVGIEMGGTAKTLALAASGASAAGALQYMKSLNSIDPDAVYADAMRQLNSHIGVLEAMGAPLVGTEMRGYILSGGGVRLKGLIPTPRAQRLHMVFLLRGADARGMVAIQAKRRQGKTSFQLLALDIPADSGKSARIFLRGQPSDYRGGGVFDELYVPLQTAGTMKPAQDAEDDAEDLAIAAMRRDVLRPKALTEGGGMYPWERLVEGIYDLRRRLVGPPGGR